MSDRVASEAAANPRRHCENAGQIVVYECIIYSVLKRINRLYFRINFRIIKTDCLFKIRVEYWVIIKRW